MTDYSKPIQWREGDRHRIGRVAIVRYSETMTGHVTRNTFWFAEDGKPGVNHGSILVVHAHTGELEFVPTASLSNCEPIEEPTK